MTSICTSGVSEQKPGFGLTVSMGSAAISQFLNKIPMAWAIALSGLVGFLTWELDVYCADDPPADPGFTAADAVALTSPMLGQPYVDAVAKFRDLVGHYLWYDLCQCVGGSTPAAPGPISAPTDMPTIDPPSVAPPVTSAACLTVHDGPVTNLTGGGTNWAIGASAVRIPTLAKWYRLTVTQANVAGGGHQNLGESINWYNEYGQNLNSPAAQFFISQSGTTQVYDFPVDVRATHWFAFHSFPGVVTHDTLEATLEFFCTGDRPSTPTVTTTTDPVAQAMLSTILQLVTLIQRQVAPFAAIDSGVHSGLTGEGSISVQGLIGCRVDLTTIPGYTGLQAGDTDAIFDAGWINWATEDATRPREFLVTSVMISTPPLAGLYTRISYSLNPGVVATITEMRREF